MRSVLFLSGLFMGANLYAQTPEAIEPKSEEPQHPAASDAASISHVDRTKVEDDEGLDDANSGLDPLAFTQKELQKAFKGGIALNLGPVMPWSEYGASIFWSKFDIIQSFSAGAGSFEFSNNYRSRNFKVKTDSQSLYYAARWFFLGFGPLYVEPFGGLARWSGSITPSGYDDSNDTLASSLNSRFDITGVSLGANLGIMWNFQNGVFIDYNLANISTSAPITRSFTTNTSEARRNVNKELAGPLSMSNLQLRIGYGLEI